MTQDSGLILYITDYENVVIEDTLSIPLEIEEDSEPGRVNTIFIRVNHHPAGFRIEYQLPKTSEVTL